MRKIKYFINLAFLLFFCTSFLFEKTIKEEESVQKEIVDYYVKEIPVMEVLYKIKNIENQPVWIWINKANLSQYTDSLKIREYFRRVKGDWSLYQLAMDGNVEGFKPTVFFSFFKVIQPEETFVIQILAEDYLSPNSENSNDWIKIQEVKEVQQKKLSEQIVTTLEKHISIVPQSLVLKQAPGMENEIVKKQFYYKPSSIAITWKLFYSELN